MLDEQLALATKKTAHESAQADARAFFHNKGITGPMAETMVAGVKAPLIGFSDGSNVHFVGEDADTVAVVLDATAEVSANTARFQIDTRKWNEALTKLNEAGHQVSLTAVE
jgi:hypothetical protein